MTSLARPYHLTRRRSSPRSPFRAPLSGPVVVTGASSGIGEATVLRLAAGGQRVLATVRRKVDADRLRAHSDLIETELVDVTSQADVSRLRERLRDERDGLAGLVNNAGTATVGPIEEISVDAWRRAVETNVLGTIAVTKACIPGLLAGGGRVVNVSSPSGRLAFPLLGPYAVTKFALEAFNDTLRRELAHQGVRVICVSPGVVSTPLYDKGLRQADAMLASADPEVVERYAGLTASAQRAAIDGAAGARPAADVAAVIARALTARAPRLRYTVGADARAASVAARVLPDRLLDGLLAQLTSR